VVHLESGAHAVIVQGRARRVPLTRPLDRRYYAKYATHLSGFPASVGVYRVDVEHVSAWTEKSFTETATRWVLGGAKGARKRA
jgi:hypothetical protein